MKKTAIVSFLAVMAMATAAWAVKDGDICSIHSLYSGANPCQTPGKEIMFAIRLGNNETTAGENANFMLVPKAGAAAALGVTLEEFKILYPLMLKMSTGGYATLTGTKRYDASSALVGKTDLYFTYVVRPGDVGLPLAIAGSAGTGSDVGEPFQWQNNNYYNIGNVNDPAFQARANEDGLDWDSPSDTTPGVYWRFGEGCNTMIGDVYDPDLSKAGIRVQTFKADGSFELSVGDKTPFNLSCFAPSESDLALFVWSDDPTYFKLYDTSGTEGDDTKKSMIQIGVPKGATKSENFIIRGLKATGDSPVKIFVSNKEYSSDLTANNVVSYNVTINSTEPTIKVTTLTGDANVSVDEGDDTREFIISLSEPAPQALTVNLTCDKENRIKFSASSVSIAKGETVSDSVGYTVLDGTDPYSVKITPSTTDTYFTKFKSLTIKTVNVAPTFDIEDEINASTFVKKTFTLRNVTDVEEDQSTLKTTFFWPDGSQTDKTGAGSISDSFTFTESGDYVMTVSVQDKDGGSTTKNIKIHVSVGTPPPTVSVLPPPSVDTDPTWGRYVVNETNDSVFAVLVNLSTKYVQGPVDVKLTPKFPDPAIENIKFIGAADDGSVVMRFQAGETNALVNFTVQDGTQLSSSMGVTIVPEVTNEQARAIFTGVKEGSVYVENSAPVVSKPAAGDTKTYSAVPVGYEQKFEFKFTDVNADLVKENLSLVFNFGDDTGDVNVPVENVTVSTRANSHIGTVTGWVNHKFDKASADPEGYAATFYAADKDGTPFAENEFFVKVVSAPTIAVAPIGSEEEEIREQMVEESDSPLSKPLRVILSRPYDYPLNIKLTVTNPEGNGSLKLSKTTVTVPAGERYSESVMVTPQDGTFYGSRFEVTPELDPTDVHYADASKIFSGASKKWTYTVQNVVPVMARVNPANSQDNPKVISLGEFVTFSWSVTDVSLDFGEPFKVVWTWPNGDQETSTSRSGTIKHKFDSAGMQHVTVSAFDKDGAESDQVDIYLEVETGKVLKVTPKGPDGGGYKSNNATYTGQFGSGLGAGWVRTRGDVGSLEHSGASYLYTFGQSTMQANVEAIPYQVRGEFAVVTNWVDNTTYSLQNFPYDSFFYVWVDGGNTGKEGSSPFVDGTEATMPHGVATAMIALPNGSEDTVSSVAVGAVFSREYLASDFTADLPNSKALNLGDINLDGVPDILAMKTDVNVCGGMTRAQVASLASTAGQNGVVAGGEEGGNDGERVVDYVATVDLGTFNLDLGTNGVAMGDYLPLAANAEFAPGCSNVYAGVGTPFTGLLEIRGFEEHLNYQRDEDGAALDPSFPLDEPGAEPGVIGGTNPAVDDTDGDGLPDGWEYYFWWYYGHEASESGLSDHPAGKIGYAFDPKTITGSVVIPTHAAFNAFNPIKWTDSSADTDGDGLSNYEELICGTNPLNWDTDGDGMPDGWEVLMGLNPCDAADASGNPDGDFMAYATTTRDRFAVLDESGNVACHVLCKVVTKVNPEGETVEEKVWYSEYKYGRDDDPDAPLALGRVLTQEAVDALGTLDESSVESVEVAILHWQVYAEFGFDPRTGWGGPSENTRAFTSYDEFLLAKFMLNVFSGAPEKIEASELFPKQSMFREPGLVGYTTNPRTPDTDAFYDPETGEQYFDGMPDGWELYLAFANGKDTGKFSLSPWTTLDGIDDEGKGVDFDQDNETSVKPLYNANEFGASLTQILYEHDGEKSLTNLYTSVYNTNMMYLVSLARPSEDIHWVNKLWPTDPYNPDTDNDGIMDADERATAVQGQPITSQEEGTGVAIINFLHTTDLQYDKSLTNGNVITENKRCIRGGGLNPCSWDTDGDCLPDAWECAFVGQNAKKTEGGNGRDYIANGMDGTFGPANDWNNGARIGMGDAYSFFDDYVTTTNLSAYGEMSDSVVSTNNIPGDFDFDGDGLENYQEYWTQAVRGWRYDLFGQGTLKTMFDGEPMPWDEQAFSHTLLDAGGNPVPVRYMRPVAFMAGASYVGTDPRTQDTDGDGMDDFYEIFHGLNPLLGGVDRISDASGKEIDWTVLPPPATSSLTAPNAVLAPWSAGLPFADPDGDGLRNFEEYLCAHNSPTDTSNTDPSPLWLTDIGYPQSITAGYYFFDEDDPATPYFWWGAPFASDGTVKHHAVFSFEMNEGYDSDNDGISDKQELLLTSTSQSDPQQSDDPVRRQALWFDGEDSAAAMLGACQLKTIDMLKNFTVELWARPERTARTDDEVLIERPVWYPLSDAYNPDNVETVIRLNFRIAIDAEGHPYAMYQNAGLHDEVSGECIVKAPKTVEAGKWYHFAAVMDGVNGAFNFYINGQLVYRVDSKLIPANGASSISMSVPIAGTVGKDSFGEATYARNPAMTYFGRLVIGASDATPLASADLEKDLVSTHGALNFYNKFFKGWIDEVRVWNGARTAAEIGDNYRYRFSRDEVLANRTEVIERRAAGWGSGIGQSQLPPELLYHFTFDNLFSAETEGEVAQAPRGFNHGSVVCNRPDDYSCTWWKNLASKSVIYTNGGKYDYVPWIENTVSHLPDECGFVQDSCYWSKYFAGPGMIRYNWSTGWSTELEQFTFPYTAKLYGLVYTADETDAAHYRQNEAVTKAEAEDILHPRWPHNLAVVSTDKAAAEVLADSNMCYNRVNTLLDDMLPFGHAWAKLCPEMWDNDSPSSAWAETGEDTDGNGLPDWWEQWRLGNSVAGVVWTDLDGVSGLTMGERYLRDVAAGYTASKNPSVAEFDESMLIPQTSDIDRDGLPDWWENLFNLDAASAEGANGAFGDPDRDGLCNYAEYLISEVYWPQYPEVFRYSRPDRFKTGETQVFSDYFEKIGTKSMSMGLMFADHDMVDDSWEDLYDTEFANSRIWDADVDADDDGWSNWAEARYGTTLRRCDPTLKSYVAANGDTINEFPIPVLKTKIQYLGSQRGNIVVSTYSAAKPTAAPDARFTIATSADAEESSGSKYLGYWEAKPYVVRLSPGSVIPGSLKVIFTDSLDNLGQGCSGVLGADKGNIPETSGVLYQTVLDQDGTEIMTSMKIGTINYLTGELVFDASAYAEIEYIILGIGPHKAYHNGEEINYAIVKSANSYMTVTYKVKQVDSFPKTYYLADADAPLADLPSGGFVREGLNYITAFMDVNGDGIWNAGEPYGVAKPYGTQIGWDVNDVEIELTDYSDAYVRYSLPEGMRSTDLLEPRVSADGGEGSGGASGVEVPAGSSVRVRIDRIAVDGSTAGIGNTKSDIFDAVVYGPNTSLTEADLLAQGFYGLDWGLSGITPTTRSVPNVSYRLYVGEGKYSTNVVSYVFTNYFDAVQATPTPVSPIGGEYIYTARPTFKWTMPEKYPAFELQIYNTANKLVYDSGIQPRPVSDSYGNCVWTAPISVDEYIPATNTRLESNKKYTWKVMALDSRWCNTTVGTKWSTSSGFRLNMGENKGDAGGYSGVKAKIHYCGPATTLLENRVRFELFENAGFAGTPIATRTLTASEVEQVIANNDDGDLIGVWGVAPGTYYARAFIDHNQNGVRDPWESWGYANYYGQSDRPYDPREVVVPETLDAPEVEIFIEDCDTDRDWFPDAWEYEQNPGKANFLELIGASASSRSDARVNWTLSSNGSIPDAALFSVGAFLTMANVTDSDNDGLDDRTELLLGTSAKKFSTSGDGVADGTKMGLGLAPADTLTVDMNGFANGEVSWTVAVDQASGVAAKAARSFLAASAAPTCTWKLQFTESLTGEWRTIRTGTVTLDGEREQSASVADAISGSPSGFFRVVLGD